MQDRKKIYSEQLLQIHTDSKKRNPGKEIYATGYVIELKKDCYFAGFKEGNQCETLLGVTGSGKTFTMANVIAQLNKPTLIIAHNKTLVAQLYGEFKEFFPNNAVEYFVS